MGEYVKINNKTIKLGTCEDLYYVRFDQLKENLVLMHQVDGNDKPEEYLNPKNGYRYRFPFPDEDIRKIGEYEKFNRGLLIGVPYEILDGVEHGKICVPTSCQGAYNVNQYVSCPADPSFKITCSAKTDRAPLEIIQQKQVDDQLWTVCRCGWCGRAFRLDQEAAMKLCAAIDELYKDEYWQEVIKRIMRGYERVN
ncbi:MAG: hypothetical protein V2A70_00770 [Candidatus Omnitrophota bacterium]